ncbi:MAG: sulfur dioxygenase, partial [Myxococcota bacterium]
MIFRQLFDRASCTLTYVLGDEASKSAVIIDPVFEHHQRDTALLRELGLKLLFSLDTHCHADHVTGGYLMREATGCQTVLSRRIGAENVDVPVDHGDVITFGDQRLVVRATPGHTAGCVTYVTERQDRAFTGDALLIRGAGRTDFQGGSAEDLYASITQQIFTLPAEAALFPGHDYQGRLQTTVDEERRFNSRIGGDASARDFIGYMDNLGLPHPRHIAVALPANMRNGKPEGPPTPRDSWAPLTYTYGGVVEVAPDWVATHLANVTIVDVRDAVELQEGLGVIKGAVHIPLRELRERLLELDDAEPIATVCHAGRRSAMGAAIMRKAGLTRVANL